MIDDALDIFVVIDAQQAITPHREYSTRSEHAFRFVKKCADVKPVQCLRDCQ